MSILNEINNRTTEHIQTLWSGYGSIKRVWLDENRERSVIVKHVELPDEVVHPRGWNTNLSHQRKVRSYQVESTWYESFSSKCDKTCRVPECLELRASENEFYMVLEDLDAAGFNVRHDSLSPEEMLVCLDWLAHFHATFMNSSPTLKDKDSLWPVGTYWHLDTRPDELAALDDLPLKKAAQAIDQKLSNARYQSFVHGDAKLANFCFADNGKSVSAVDFQYVGGGCGMKDVAYFIGSCLYEDDCEQYEDYLLNYYFRSLESALKQKQSQLDAHAIEKEWRSLFPFAWADFHRFVKGWNPGHWKINAYSERMTQKVITELAQANK